MHATKRTPTGGGTGRRCYVCDEPVRRAKGRHLWQHVRRNPRCAAEKDRKQIDRLKAVKP